MIAIVSSSTRERTAFASMCENRDWVCAECDSVRALKKLIRHTRVHVVLTRHRLNDGYSDDVLAALADANSGSIAKTIVLLASGTPPGLEARQVKLGAECVLRDPVRTEVLLEYLAKYREARSAAPRETVTPKTPQLLSFAGARVHLTDREVRHGQRRVRITPRELDLLEVLAESEDQVVSYQTLFSEILGRRYRGDTSNLRVLLGLLDASMQKTGISLRRWVEVIPKLGYRYRRPPLGTPAQRKNGPR